ncbi:hypothetical protein [Prosthecomicrobium sp. N25]|uniref:hypothetical protein n=1 Tax=Prosthecomicrobium sp. N25 TaxID=3129254 RepID=UPI003076C9A9
MTTDRLLKTALLLDAAASGATGLLLALGGGALAGWLGLPEALLREAGLVLLPFVAGLLWLARSRPIPRAGVWIVVGANLAWVAASLGLLAVPVLHPTALGIAFVLAQAAAVLGFAVVQAVALGRGGAETAGA